MGCDIHWHIEVKDKEGIWRLTFPKLKEFFPEDNSDEGYLDWKDDYEVVWKNPLFVSRNYDLFAILANVRNGYGFAGCITGYGFIPIKEPQGVPEDASPEFKRVVKEWSGDGHSHSWVTLRELLDYNWNQKTTLCGLVDGEQFQVFKEKGSPEVWIGGAWGSKTEIVSNQEMERRLGSGELKANEEESLPLLRWPSVYTEVEWEVSYKKAVGNFTKKVIPAMKELGKLDNVRAVFFFDN